jgi:hypothetical protein
MNVRSLSKLSAAVMTLAVLSYCGKKSHDAAAPAPAPEPKTEAPAGPDPTKTTPANTTPPSCQTADDIDTHVTNAHHKATAFCFHKVEHPAARLKDRQAIASDMQLKQDLDVAFSNVQKIFDDAQTSCASLGAGWHAPLSNNDQYATPQAASNSNSLEAVGRYFAGTTSNYFWSSSTVSVSTNDAMFVDLEDGFTHSYFYKDSSLKVVCVRP